MSGYYKNSSTISKLKNDTKDWIWDEEWGDLCPDCKNKIREK